MMLARPSALALCGNDRCPIILSFASRTLMRRVRSWTLIRHDLGDNSADGSAGAVMHVSGVSTAWQCSVR